MRIMRPERSSPSRRAWRCCKRHGSSGSIKATFLPHEVFRPKIVTFTQAAEKLRRFPSQLDFHGPAPLFLRLLKQAPFALEMAGDWGPLVRRSAAHAGFIRGPRGRAPRPSGLRLHERHSLQLQRRGQRRGRLLLVHRLQRGVRRLGDGDCLRLHGGQHRAGGRLLRGLHDAVRLQLRCRRHAGGHLLDERLQRGVRGLCLHEQLRLRGGQYGCGPGALRGRNAVQPGQRPGQRVLLSGGGIYVPGEQHRTADAGADSIGRRGDHAHPQSLDGRGARHGPVHHAGHQLQLRLADPQLHGLCGGRGHLVQGGANRGPVQQHRHGLSVVSRRHALRRQLEFDQRLCHLSDRRLPRHRRVCLRLYRCLGLQLRCDGE